MRQLAGVAVGVLIMVLVWRVDYRIVAGYQWVFLAVSAVLILSPHLPVIGVNTMGATS